MSDNVEDPSHYNAGGIETIDGIRAALGDGFLDYCRGNILKYVWRCRHKGNTLEDLRKAAKYLEWAIAEAENDATEPTKPEHVEGVWVEEAEANASKIEPTEWIPKVGDRVRVVKPGRFATGHAGTITETYGELCTVQVLNVSSRDIEAKDLELIEAAS